MATVSISQLSRIVCPVIVTTLLFLGTVTAQADTVEMISHERSVAAYATIREMKYDTAIGTDLGIFNETVSAVAKDRRCISAGTGTSKCMSFISSSSATQKSSIVTVPYNNIEIKALGSARAQSKLFGDAGAVSLLISRFEVVGQAYYEIYGNTAGDTSISLVGPGGLIVEQPDNFSGTSYTGLLSTGIYTLTAQAARSVLYPTTREVSSNYDLIMTVAAIEPTEKPRCQIEMSKQNYLVGETVTASVLRLKNPLVDTTPLELKLWVRLPDGLDISARDDGDDEHDGTLVFFGGFTTDLGPVTVLEGASDSIPGIYEFSCRLLDPITGKVLSEDRNLFEVLPLPLPTE